MKNSKIIYCLTALVCVCFISCSFENPIMEKWWQEEKPEEVEYVPIVKMIPQVTYETLIEHEYIYRDIFVQLPPEVIHDTIVEEVQKEVPVYIYETIIEKVPEIVYETITEYQTVYEEVEKIVPGPPTEEDIIKYIEEHPSDVIEIIKQDPNWKEILKEIIKDIPPEEMITYLTDEQIKYIINQQPPQIILQTIDIIDIEYIIFSGDQKDYNANAPTATGTSVTAQEKTSNDTTIAAMAQALKDNPDYLMILHGHANPTTSTPSEIPGLIQLSLDRANDVNRVLKAKFKELGGDATNWDTRVSAKGYGGEKNLSVTNSTYAGLNRRVEMILVRVGVQ
jgi:hypothetical protein